jgi:hypothetical protein
MPTDSVIEGYVDPTESLRDEGSLGDHAGYYTLPKPYPGFHGHRRHQPQIRRFPSSIRTVLNGQGAQFVSVEESVGFFGRTCGPGGGPEEKLSDWELEVMRLFYSLFVITVHWCSACSRRKGARVHQDLFDGGRQHCSPSRTRQFSWA